MENNKDINEAELPFSKGNPFGVPENYFEKLPSKIFRLIEEQESPKISVISPYRRALIFVSYAAMVTVVCLIGLKILIPTKTELTADEISEYVNQNGIIDDLEIDEIVSYSSSNLLDSINAHTSLNREEVNYIESILLEEDVEMDDLINAL